MSTAFSPIDAIEMFCRYCGKVGPAQLDRSIAENGRTIDRNSTFEYYCAKCFKTACFCGNDLLEAPKGKTEKAAVREYTPSEHYVIGEKIFHKKFKETGLVVSRDNGTPSKITVQFEKAGLKKLVQDL